MPPWGPPWRRFRDARFRGGPFGAGCGDGCDEHDAHDQDAHNHRGHDHEAGPGGDPTHVFDRARAECRNPFHRHLRRLRAVHELHHRRHRFRHYFGAHLHRRLFLWFGMSILTTAIITAVVFHAVGREHTPGFLPFLVAGMALWLLSGKIAYRIARPLSELVRVTQEIGAGRLSARARLPSWRLDEFASLARSINDMATRIERQIGDQRELLAGVSHEIRTPLSRIRVLLELGRSRGGDAKTFDELEREVLEIDSLVGQLLASARLDFAEISTRALDPVEVARRALTRAGVAEDGVLMIAPGTAQARLRADATLLSRALANLLDNARRHGRGVVRLTVRAADGVVAFDVDDAGPGFPTSGEKRERTEGSLGLGLTLVRRIADAHKGSLLLGNRDPEPGARATLEFPLGGPDEAAVPVGANGADGDETNGADDVAQDVAQDVAEDVDRGERAEPAQASGPTRGPTTELGA